MKSGSAISGCIVAGLLTVAGGPGSGLAQTDGVVDNERKICPELQRAVYAGPERGQNDRTNWIAENFSCR